MEILGFVLAIFIGITLGLIGSGGSVFAIPILVYIMHILPTHATTYSLFIVGIAALVGGIKGAKDGLLNYKMAFFFGVPSVVAIFVMRKFVMPELPNHFFTILGFVASKDLFIMLVFSGMMILSSIAMIGKHHEQDLTPENQKVNKSNIVLKGVLVGLLSGFVGVGGGFLIIPTLIFSANLSMKQAVSTSLIIISINSLIGFVGSLGHTTLNWGFLLLFTAFAVSGIFIGMYLSKRISNEKLKPAFGWFVLTTGIYILFKEIFF